MQAPQLRPGEDHTVAVNEEVLRAHPAWRRIFAKSPHPGAIWSPRRSYVSGAGATCFFGLALGLGTSRRTGAACAAAFLRSR